MTNNTCSLGDHLNQECHKLSYVSKSDVCDITHEHKYLLSVRTGISVQNLKTICTHHEMEYFRYYGNNFRSCCNPLNLHTKVIKKNLTPITLVHHSIHNSLIPGQKICCPCLRKLRAKNDGISVEIENDPDYIDDGHIKKNVEDLNISLTSFGHSPIISKKRSYEQLQSRVKVKVRRLNESVNSVNIIEASDAETTLKAESLDYFVMKLREKYDREVNITEKIKLLTLVPIHWTLEFTMQEFNTTQYMVREARKLRDEKGILGDRILENNKPKKLTPDVTKTIKEFYENEENSRLLPGKKDYISVNTDVGKSHKQKILILCNLKELYAAFKLKYPEIKVGFSTFASLRPKWCVLAGSSGTHSVCVCQYHENPKLKLCALDSTLELKTMMAIQVCSVNSEECMLHKCENCGGVNAVKMELERYATNSDTYTFKQWVNVDRSELTTITEDAHVFIENLSLDIWKLSIHEFVRHRQAAYLRNLKDSLPQNEILVIGDFAENYTCIVQNSIQAAYFSATQVTLHPFAAYYNTTNGLTSKCYCILSNSMDHNHVAVHSFLKELLPKFKSLVSELKHIHYFSDGSAAQYKNRYNLVNLANHKHDFGVEASWNFFATSHGKNVCDGIGGTVKRVLSKLSLQGHLLNNAERIMNCCIDKIKGIEFIYVDKLAVSQCQSFLQTRYQKMTDPIRGTRSFHAFRITDNGLAAYTLSEHINGTLVIPVKESLFNKKKKIKVCENIQSTSVSNTLTDISMIPVMGTCDMSSRNSGEAEIVP